MNRYTVYITPSALNEIKSLPGNMRQRVKKIVDALANEPRPSRSIALNESSMDVSRLTVEPRRIRIDQWRIIYAITAADRTVDVVAVRKRPPYDYDDLEELLADIL